jgi:hypothetical protein
MTHEKHTSDAAALIPHPDDIQDRLSENLREGRYLRRLYDLSLKYHSEKPRGGTGRSATIGEAAHA